MTPENKQKLLKVGIIALVVLLVCNVCFTVFNETQHRNELTRLRNEVAARDHTIEVANGVYTKLALESSALKGLLDDKTTEVDALQKQLKKTGDELLSVNKVAIRWKKAYESVTEGQQTPVPPVKPGDPERTKVEFAQAFGFLKVSGYTLTDPPRRSCGLSKFVRCSCLWFSLKTRRVRGAPT